MYGVMLTQIDAELRKAAEQLSTNVLHHNIRVLSLLIKRMSQAELHTALLRIKPTMVKCLKNRNAMIRKDVVVCFVACHKVIGDELLPYLEDINKSHARLIQKYIEMDRS